MAERYLLDSHILYWAVTEEARLVATERRLIASTANKLFVSTATLWELNIKAGLGKLQLPDNFMTALEPGGYSILGITFAHMDMCRHLPLRHRDPFDRMLVAQAITEGLTIITRDPNIRRYAVAVLEA